MQHTLPIITVNGIIDAQVSPLDRGFTYGDGVFETCRMTKAIIPLWSFHKQRLLNSCGKLAIPVDINVIEAQLANIILKVNESDKNNAIVKIILTRGPVGRGYSVSTLVTPTIVIGVFPATQHPEFYFSEGVNVRLCDLRLGCNTSLAGIKHLNRLEQVLARAEWNDKEIAEGILLDGNGNLIEAVFSNVFLVKNDELVTPDLSEAGVAGVMRRFIIERVAPKAGINITVRKCTLDDLVSSDEVFLCNSNYGIWPVKTFIAGQDYKFSVGPLTLQLQNYLQQLLS